MGDHGISVVLDERAGGDVEISEHDVGFPSADEADFVGVNAGEEEGHGTSRAG